MVAITRKKDGSKKDTLRNIEETKEFVINWVNPENVEQMNQCSAEYPYGVDEMEKVGLTPLPSVRVRPPRVTESPIQMECRLYQTMEVGNGVEGSSTVVVGTIEELHLKPHLYSNGKIILEQLQPICRLAGTSYGHVRDVFDLPRPKV
jgi:flavin reductase (DIM6/NTAB) family NADH-FMN oxidoreductase RutF